MAGDRGKAGGGRENEGGRVWQGTEGRQVGRQKVGGSRGGSGNTIQSVGGMVHMRCYKYVHATRCNICPTDISAVYVDLGQVFLLQLCPLVGVHQVGHHPGRSGLIRESWDNGVGCHGTYAACRTRLYHHCNNSATTERYTPPTIHSPSQGCERGRVQTREGVNEGGCKREGVDEGGYKREGAWMREGTNKGGCGRGRV